MSRWWASRSLRARVVLGATAPAAAAIVVGAVAVALVFSTGRVHDLDSQTRQEAQQLSMLVTSGQVPSTLPVPAGSPLLAQVLRADGTVLAASPSASRVLPLVGDSGARVLTTNDTSYAGTPLRVRAERVTAADGTALRVVVAAPLGDVHRALRALLLVLFLVVPVLVVLTAVIVWAVAGLALRPVERLRTAADALTRPEADRELLPQPPGDDEIARLARTLNRLLSSSHAMVAKQEAFVADAAHELRSPLTSLRVQLEVAQAHPDLLDLPTALADLSAEVSRLEALVSGLLALARLQGDDQLELVPLDLREIACATGDQAEVLGDAASLERLVDNLRANAQRHAGRVSVTTSIHGDWAVLDVDDDGPGIPVADRDRVFDRWVKLDPARPDGSGAAGLGLAIVREVARLHGGTVTVLDSPLGGARLQVRLPHIGTD